MNNRRAPDRENNFDLIRLIAALAVLVGHSFPLSYGDGTGDIVFLLGHKQASLGVFAVWTFFIVSGYLITQSFVRSQNPIAFTAARALRLLPALAASLLLIAFVIGPLVTTLPLDEYFAQERLLRFVFVNLSLVEFNDQLPGVFETNPFPWSTTGSVWTLHYEAQCYVMVLLLGVVGLLNRWMVAALFAAALVASKLWIGGHYVGFSKFFLAGAVMALWRPPMKAWIAAACLGMVIAAFFVGGLRIAYAIAGTYAVIYAAIALKPVALPFRADLSYGVYLWAFPIQQCTSWMLGAAACWWANTLISFPIVLVLAVLSWHFIEAPALALKRGWRGRPTFASSPVG